MKRRDFLKSGLYGVTAMNAAMSLSWPSMGLAAPAAISVPKTLVNIMLLGGADMRYAIAPTPDYDSVYVNQYWAARRGVYLNSYPDYAAMYADQYTTVSDTNTGFSFGIHNSCQWLAQQFEAGNVAIVSNVFGSLNRRHDHSQIIVNSGDLNAGQLDLDRDGWGGRLVETLSGSPKVAAINSNVSLFAFGSNSQDRLAQVFHGRNMRKIALPVVDPDLPVDHSRNVTRRALMAYYGQRGIEIVNSKPLNWPYRRFFNQYDSLRVFGDQIEARLSGYPLPMGLANLNLNNDEVELQIRNLYDCCLTTDILNHRLVSMAVGGWDTHTGQYDSINGLLQSLFGSNGGLDVLTSQLAVDVPGANNNLVYAFSSDFGRQLAANGSKGTDHGRGSYSLLVGQDINGGVYGEMFPQKEALPDPSDSKGRTPMEIPGKDIDGLTSFERVYAQACNWLEQGTASTVFPNATSSAIEPGVDLSSLFVV